MNCELWEIMDKNEQYARGWIRLHSEPENIYMGSRMGQYAIDLMRLKNQHAETCETCKENK